MLKRKFRQKELGILDGPRILVWPVVESWRLLSLIYWCSDLVNLIREFQLYQYLCVLFPIILSCVNHLFSLEKQM